MLKQITKVTIGLSMMFAAANLIAQAIAENVLDDIVISTSNYTGIVKVKFKVPVRYLSHSPVKEAKEIRIKVDLLRKISPASAIDAFGIRESLVPQYKQSFGLEEVLYETEGRDSYVTLFFNKDVSFEIIQDSSYRSLSILLHGAK